MPNATLSAQGRLPDNTPVTQMGLSPNEVALLSPTARKLVKSDLMNMRAFAQSNRDLNESALLTAFDQRYDLALSITDLHSVEEAFSNMDQRMMSASAAQDTKACCCCSCCPCCSCTASVVTSPVTSFAYEHARR